MLQSKVMKLYLHRDQTLKTHIVLICCQLINKSASVIFRVASVMLQQHINMSTYTSSQGIKLCKQ